MNIAKDTAKRMLQNIEQQLQSLAAEQQSMNGNKGNAPGMRKGGQVRRRYDTGGSTGYDPLTDPIMQQIMQRVKPQGDPLNRLAYPFENGSKAQPYSLPGSQTIAPRKVLALNPTGTGNNTPLLSNPGDWGGMNAYKAPDEVNGQLPDQMGSLNDQGASNINFSNPSDNPALGGGFRGLMKRPGNSGTAMDWMGALPGIFNLAAGLMTPKAQKLNPNQFQNPYEQQALAGMPSQYRIDPQLNEAKNAYANYIRNVNNQGNSRGERMANYGAGMNQYNATVGAAYADKNNQENIMATRRADMMNQQGMQRANVNLNVQNMNDQNAAATRNYRTGYLGAGVSDLQKNYLVNKQMGNQQESQNAYIKALMNMPHFKEWLGLDPNNLLGIQNNK